MGSMDTNMSVTKRVFPRWTPASLYHFFFDGPTSVRNKVAAKWRSCSKVFFCYRLDGHKHVRNKVAFFST